MLWVRDNAITDSSTVNNFTWSGKDIFTTTCHIKVLCVRVYRGMDILLRNTSRRRV